MRNFLDFRSRKICLIALFVFIFILGFAIGFYYGSLKMAEWFSAKIIYFVQLKGDKVEIDANQLAYGIMQYQSRIGACYPLNNSL